jgi:urea transport system permease protein
MGWSPWLAAPVALVVGVVLGMIVERAIVRPLYGRPLDAILATRGLGIVVVQLITIGFGRGVHSSRARSMAPCLYSWTHALPHGGR